MNEAEVMAVCGEDGIRAMVAAFYRRVKVDALIGPMYPADDWAGSEERLAEFMLFRLGGSTRYMEMRGHPKLRMRHITFKIGVAERDRWLELMAAAMEETAVPVAAREFLDPFFAQVADFMRNQADRCFGFAVGSGETPSHGGHQPFQNMPDPTEAAILTTFSVALVIFTITAVVRKWMGKTGGESVATLEGSLGNERVPTWFYHRLDLLGLGLIFVVFLALVVGGLRVKAEPEIRVDGLLVSIGFQFLTAFGVAALVVRRIGLADWLGLKWRQWPWVFGIAPAAVFGMWMLFGVMHFSGYMSWLKSHGVDGAQESVKLLQESKDPLILGLMAFAAVIVAPICEEVVFRGYFYGAGKKFAGPWCAGLCSALVFSAAHGNAMALLPIFVLGCLLAFVYEKTGSLWAPIAVHFCFNGSTVFLQFAARFLQLPLDPNS